MLAVLTAVDALFVEGGYDNEPPDGVLGQESARLVEGPVRADAQGAAFVGGGDEAEQQLGCGVVQGAKPAPSSGWARVA
ncbi:hypothetical protein [Actinomadura alba]|uniref:Uncharacterized protein n=1 Tax=Actinomadura alba TaxID=406431 RepID=A0ABR7LYK5_9ACTN|nr:hypothetical protein [Actinomadura alba]MBC6469937.1 hypothetical protein [Actinomadura alba]